MAAKKKMTFAGAMSQAPGKAWEAARNAEIGGKRELPRIDDGTYPCRVKDAKADTDKDGNPYVSYKLIVLEGEFEGVKLDKFHSIKDWDMDLERLVKSFKGMGYTGFEKVHPKGMTAFIQDIVDDINQNEPEVMVGVKNGTYKARKDGDGYKKGDEIPKLDIYVNRPRSAEEGATEAAPAPKKTAKKTTRRK